MSITTKIRALVTSATIATAAFAGSFMIADSADAMQFVNCTGKGLYVRIRMQPKNTIIYKNLNLRTGEGVTLDLSRSNTYQVIFGAGDTRKTFSGWKAEDFLSFRTLYGNTEISRGNKYCGVKEWLS